MQIVFNFCSSERVLPQRFERSEFLRAPSRSPRASLVAPMFSLVEIDDAFFKNAWDRQWLSMEAEIFPLSPRGLRAYFPLKLKENLDSY